MNPSRTRDPSGFLRLSLRANALFSTLSGLAFILASGSIAAFLGEVPSVVVLVIGVQLVAFAALLGWLSVRREISIPLAISIIVADLLWVAGTAVVIYADLFTRGGEVLALCLADVVLLLAILQSIGVRRMGATGLAAGLPWADQAGSSD